jgi:hypothetical protein
MNCIEDAKNIAIAISPGASSRGRQHRRGRKDCALDSDEWFVANSEHTFANSLVSLVDDGVASAFVSTFGSMRPVNGINFPSILSACHRETVGMARPSNRSRV